MALVKCQDCERDVSDQAPACPNCGRPIHDGASESQRRTDAAVASWQASQSTGQQPARAVPSKPPEDSTACPKCHQIDQIQKLSSIVQAGTDLGRQLVLSPPVYESPWGAGTIGILIGLLVFGFLLMAPGVFGLIDIVIIIYLISVANKRKAKAKAAGAAWVQAKQRWDNLYYCHRNDGFYLPGETELKPISALYRYVYTPSPMAAGNTYKTRGVDKLLRWNGQGKNFGVVCNLPPGTVVTILPHPEHAGSHQFVGSDLGIWYIYARAANGKDGFVDLRDLGSNQ